jgi:hypothetical protein
MSNLKKYLSFWIYIMFHVTKKVLYTIASKRNQFVKMLEYKHKSLDNYYRGEGTLFVWLQIIIFWTSLINSIIDSDFFPFKVCLGLVSLIAVLRTIEYIEPDLIP